MPLFSSLITEQSLQECKEVIKLSLQMTWCLCRKSENHHHHHHHHQQQQRFLELISDYKNVAVYKVKVQKSIDFSYTNNEHMESEIKNTTPFTLTSPKVKYLGVNLTKYVWDLYEENYKTLLLKEIKELNKWRISPCTWIGRLNIVKMLILLNLIYRFNIISVKIPASHMICIGKNCF